MSCCCCGGASGVRYYHELRFELPWISLEPYASIYQRRCGSRSSGGVRIQVQKELSLLFDKTPMALKHSTNNGDERFQRDFFWPSIFDAKEAAEIWFVFRIPAIATAFQPKDNGSQERVEVEAAHHLGAAQVGGTSLTTG